MAPDSIKAALADLGSQVGGFAPYWAILVLVALDVLLGLALAILRKTLDAKAIARTVPKVLGITLALGLAMAMALATPSLGALTAMVLAHAAASEALSIVRNTVALCRHLGVEPPAILVKVDEFLVTTPATSLGPKQEQD